LKFDEIRLQNLKLNMIYKKYIIFCFFLISCLNGQFSCLFGNFVSAKSSCNDVILRRVRDAGNNGLISLKAELEAVNATSNALSSTIETLTDALELVWNVLDSPQQEELEKLTVEIEENVLFINDEQQTLARLNTPWSANEQFGMFQATFLWLSLANYSSKISNPEVEQTAVDNVLFEVVGQVKELIQRDMLSREDEDVRKMLECVNKTHRGSIKAAVRNRTLQQVLTEFLGSVQNATPVRCLLLWRSQVKLDHRSVLWLYDESWADLFPENKTEQHRLFSVELKSSAQASSTTNISWEWHPEAKIWVPYLVNVEGRNFYPRRYYDENIKLIAVKGPKTHRTFFQWFRPRYVDGLMVSKSLRVRIYFEDLKFKFPTQPGDRVWVKFLYGESTQVVEYMGIGLAGSRFAGKKRAILMGSDGPLKSFEYFSSEEREKLSGGKVYLCIPSGGTIHFGNLYYDVGYGGSRAVLTLGEAGVPVKIEVEPEGKNFKVVYTLLRIFNEAGEPVYSYVDCRKQVSVDGILVKEEFNRPSGMPSLNRFEGSVEVEARVFWPGVTGNFEGKRFWVGPKHVGEVVMVVYDGSHEAKRIRTSGGFINAAKASRTWDEEKEPLLRRVWRGVSYYRPIVTDVVSEFISPEATSFDKVAEDMEQKLREFLWDKKGKDESVNEQEVKECLHKQLGWIERFSGSRGEIIGVLTPKVFEVVQKVESPWIPIAQFANVLAESLGFLSEVTTGKLYYILDMLDMLVQRRLVYEVLIPDKGRFIIPVTPDMQKEVKKLYQRWKDKEKKFPNGYLGTVEELKEDMEKQGLELEGLTFFYAFIIWRGAIYQWYEEMEVEVPYAYLVDMERVKDTLRQALEVEGLELQYTQLEDALAKTLIGDEEEENKTESSIKDKIIAHWNKEIIGDIYAVENGFLLSAAEGFLRMASLSFEQIPWPNVIQNAITDFRTVIAFMLRRNMLNNGNNGKKFIGVCHELKKELETILENLPKEGLDEYIPAFEEMLYVLDQFLFTSDTRVYRDIFERAEDLIEQGEKLDENHEYRDAEEKYLEALNILGIKIIAQPVQLTRGLKADWLWVIWAVKKYFGCNLTLASTVTFIAIGQGPKEIDIDKLAERSGINTSGAVSRVHSLRLRLELDKSKEIWDLWQRLLRKEDRIKGRFPDSWSDEFEGVPEESFGDSSDIDGFELVIRAVEEHFGYVLIYGSAKMLVAIGELVESGEEITIPKIAEILDVRVTDAMPTLFILAAQIGEEGIPGIVEFWQELLKKEPSIAVRFKGN